MLQMYVTMSCLVLHPGPYTTHKQVVVMETGEITFKDCIQKSPEITPKNGHVCTFVEYLYIRVYLYVSMSISVSL